jgi:hypothetical protein
MSLPRPGYAVKNNGRSDRNPCPPLRRDQAETITLPAGEVRNHKQPPGTIANARCASPGFGNRQANRTTRAGDHERRQPGRRQVNEGAALEKVKSVS